MTRFSFIAGRPAVRQAVSNLTAGTLGYFPGRFRIARLLGPRYSLRCVLFHDVADAESPFTKGLGVTISTREFEDVLRFLTRYYTPVRLQDVLDVSDGHELPPRPVLVTFDDAYASVFQAAAPLCRKFEVPAVFFVNAACLDNTQLALDNLICYVANMAGLEAIQAAARGIEAASPTELRCLSDVFTHLLPVLSLPLRDAFRKALVRFAGIQEGDLAGNAKLYLTSMQLRDLASFGFEIGNHTYTHVHCRCLRPKDFAGEIDRNRVILEQVSGTPVRSFSVPYGSSMDLTSDLLAHLQSSGHQAAFLVESLANQSSSDLFRIDRVSVRARSDSGLFSEIEVLPRLRVIRNWLGISKPGLYYRMSQPVQ